MRSQRTSRDGLAIALPPLFKETPDYNPTSIPRRPNQERGAVEAITQAQRFFFEANGFLVVLDALTAEELAAAREACDAAEALWRAEPERPGVRRWDLEQVAGILEYGPLFVEIVENP